MSYILIKSHDSYRKAHDDFFKNYYVDKAGLTVKSKINLLNKVLTVTPKFTFDSKSANLLSRKNETENQETKLAYLTPSASYSLSYNRKENEVSVSHSDDGKVETTVNWSLFKKDNFSAAVHLKHTVSDKDNQTVSKFRFFHDSNKLFVLGLDRENGSSAYEFKNYFKLLNLGAYYGLTASNGFIFNLGFLSNLNLEKKSLTRNQLILQGDYKNIKNNLVLGRDETEKVYFVKYAIDTKINDIKVGADFDYSTKDSNSKLKDIKETGFNVGAEFPLENDSWAKVMLNNKKDVGFAFGKNFGSTLFTFGAKLSTSNTNKLFKYEFASSINFN